MQTGLLRLIVELLEEQHSTFVESDRYGDHCECKRCEGILPHHSPNCAIQEMKNLLETEEQED